MSNHNFMNRTAPESHQLEGIEPEYPMAQWYNGMDHVPGPLGQGGFELPLENFQDLIQDIEALDIPHRNNTVEVPGYLMPVMNLCIVQSHISYHLNNHAGETIARSATARFEEGYRSKALYLCYAKEVESAQKLTPFVLSVKSTIAKEVKAILKLFRNQVLSLANNAPHYFFYIPIGANGRVSFPKAANPYTISPPVPYWNTKVKDLDPDSQMDTLADMAIPDYLYEHIQTQGMDEANKWKSALAASITQDGPSPITAPITPEPEPIAYELKREPTSEPEIINEADAEKLFYEVITEAIKTGELSVTAIADYTQSVNEAGWVAVLEQLEKDIAATA